MPLSMAFRSTGVKRAVRPDGMAGLNVEPGADLSIADLLEFATRYLARYSASEARVALVLERRIRRWYESAGIDPADLKDRAKKAREHIPAVLARLREADALNDAAFAQARMRRMARSGRSHGAIESHLVSLGIAAHVLAEVMADGAPDEFVSAVLTARRRRLGPFRDERKPGRSPMEHMAALARAGFPEHIVRKVIGLPRELAQQIAEQASALSRQGRQPPGR